MSRIHNAKLLAHGKPLHTDNPEDITGIPFLFISASLAIINNSLQFNLFSLIFIKFSITPIQLK